MIANLDQTDRRIMKDLMDFLQESDRGQALIDSRVEEHFLDFSQAKKAEHSLVSLKVSLKLTSVNNWKMLGSQLTSMCVCILPGADHCLTHIEVNNLTDIKEFVLLGFQGSSQLRIVLFCVLLVIFLVTICGNLLIITLASTSQNLHTPMYFFISQLSISDILLISDIAPNILYVLMNNGGTIAIIGCMTQIYFFSATESFECLLLTVMCYDRYVAICNPLRYTSIMTSGHCVILSISSWLLSFFASLIYIIIISRLKFCGPNVIDHLFCDLVPLQDIACSDTFPVKLQMYLLGIPLLIISSIIFVVSYVKIIRAILQISSNISRQKAFSTCSSHLTVVSIFYATLFSVYILPKSEQTSDINKITSLQYTVFTPLINPIIYSFRNKDIKVAKPLQPILKLSGWMTEERGLM
ncbi:olfactory receptor 5G9-like [Ranitomeya variabilis]|uniref:olfactory receptor 5G9-like n=1 Tax=Ranitomeya variabilis TaxID=490064 RepID=UPI00405671CC